MINRSKKLTPIDNRQLLSGNGERSSVIKYWKNLSSLSKKSDVQWCLSFIFGINLTSSWFCKIFCLFKKSINALNSELESSVASIKSMRSE